MTTEEKLTRRAHCIAMISGAGDIASSWVQKVGDLERICFHEAAHAVVALFLGEAPFSVSVDRGDPAQGIGPGGETRFEPGDEEFASGPSDAEHQQNLKYLAPALDQAAADREAARILTDEWRAVAAIARAVMNRIPGKNRVTLCRGEVRLLWEFNKSKEGEERCYSEKMN